MRVEGQGLQVVPPPSVFLFASFSGSGLYAWGGSPNLRGSSEEPFVRDKAPYKGAFGLPRC